MNNLVESELEIAWWSSLEEQYRLTGETLYRYLVLRSFVEYIKKGRMKNPFKESLTMHLASFLMKEQGIVDGADESFQGEHVHIKANSINRMTADWHTQYTFLLDRNSFERQVEEMWTSYMKEVKRKVQKWSKQPFYEMALKQAYLSKVNSIFGIKNHFEVTPIESMSLTHEQLPIRLELQFERFLHPYFLEHNEATLLDEKSIEDYLALHLDEVEDGLRLIGRQIVLERGRIDLLARDVNGDPVVIEVKVATDTDLVWQQAYYTKEITNRYGGSVRFMVIAPKWEPHIMELLLKEPNTEIKIFTPTVKQRKVQSLAFQHRYAS